MTNENDSRVWRVWSEYIGNDPEPYTTQQLFDYCNELNAENVNDPEWVPYQLRDLGDMIVDESHQRGNDGYIAAIPYETEAQS